MNNDVLDIERMITESRREAIDFWLERFVYHVRQAAKMIFYAIKVVWLYSKLRNWMFPVELRKCSDVKKR
jgi:hypothetical protein